MNEFDQFVKHNLKVKYYVRYADDFVVMSTDNTWLAGILQYTGVFLRERLRLSLHPDKISIKTLAYGTDFLGWVHFPDHRVLRTITKKRMLKNVDHKNLSSYQGMLQHGHTRKLQNQISGKA